MLLTGKAAAESPDRLKPGLHYGGLGCGMRVRMSRVVTGLSRLAIHRGPVFIELSRCHGSRRGEGRVSPKSKVQSPKSGVGAERGNTKDEKFEIRSQKSEGWN